MQTVTTLQTDRFTMRPIRSEDAAALLPTLSDAEQCRYLTRPAFASEQELSDWLFDPAWSGKTWIPEVTSGERAGQIAGRLTVHTAHQEGVEEIGYIIRSDWQGKGTASECAAALIAHRFASGVRKMVAEVDTRNAASVHLLEKLGFAREAHFREHETTHIGMCDVYWYGLLKGDWAG